MLNLPLSFHVTYRCLYSNGNQDYFFMHEILMLIVPRWMRKICDHVKMQQILWDEGCFIKLVTIEDMLVSYQMLQTWLKALKVIMYVAK